MLRATLCALLVAAATPLGAQEQKQPQAPRPVQTDVALALVLAVDASGSVSDDRFALQKQGYAKAQLYGRDEKVYGGLNAFFLLMDKPEAYGLPNEANAVLPRRNNRSGYFGAVVTAALGALAGLVALRDRGATRRAEDALRRSGPGGRM